jgi:YbbR domain-containing protein
MITFIKNLIVRNWALKLLSLVLAFLLWLTLIPEEKIFSEKTLVVPLETRNLPPDFEIVEKPLTVIDVTIRAPNRLLNQITPASLQAVLNLEKATISQEDYPLNPDMIAAPSDAKVVLVMPNKVHLKLDRSKEVLMEVSPVTIGKVKDGLTIDKIELIPSKVSVRGPESKIKPKDRVRTSPINITDLAQTAEFEADLILPNPGLRFTTAQTKAKVKVILVPK